MNCVRLPLISLLTILLACLPIVSAAQTAPVGDLQAIIDRAEAGALVEVPYGIYYGATIINKPLYLKGVPNVNGQLPIIDGEGKGTVLTITAADTTVEGFTIQASGNIIDHEDGGIVVEHADNVHLLNNQLADVLYGIRGVESNRLRIIGNTISGKDLHIARRGDSIRIWQSEECLVEGNHIENARDAIFWFSDGTRVRNNHFLNSRYGIHMMYTDRMTIEGNELNGNSVGAYLMYSKNVQITGNTFRANRGPSGYGLALKDMDGVAVTDNYYIDNRVGIFFDNSPGRVDITQPIERNVLAFNDVGVLMMPAVQRNILRNNTFLDNLEQAGIKGGGSNLSESLAGNGWDGNYWSDYVGYDVALDGIGDFPYHAESLFENLADQHPNLSLLHFSPVAQAIDLAARAFPIIKPKPKLTDRAPRIEPLLPAVTPVVAQPTHAMNWLAALLLAGAGLFVGLFYWESRPRRITDRASIPVGPDRQLGPSARVDAKHIGKPTQMDGKHSESSAIIRVQNLTKRYPQPGRPWWSDATVTAVDQLSFEIEPGQAVAFWGVNGAGKTTVIKCLLGLLDAEGELWLNNLDLRKDGRNARRSFGYVPQELAFHNDLSVIETCRFYAHLKEVALARIPIVLAQVGLTGQDRKAVGALSGGMKQRLALALALLSDPPVLLLDEPTSNLDAETRDDFLQLLVHLHHAGKTLLFTSHHLAEVEQLADRVLILQDGALLAQGTPLELLSLLSPPRVVRPHLVHSTPAVPPATRNCASGTAAIDLAIAETSSLKNGVSA